MKAAIQKVETVENETLKQGVEARAITLTPEEIDAAIVGARLSLDVLTRFHAAAIGGNVATSESNDADVNFVGGERDWLTTGQAEKFAKVTRSTLRRWLRKYPEIGERTPTGGLRFYRPALERVAFGERQRGAIGANGANDQIRKSAKA